MTPFCLSKSASTCQKQPAPKVASSYLCSEESVLDDEPDLVRALDFLDFVLEAGDLALVGEALASGFAGSAGAGSRSGADWLVVSSALAAGCDFLGEGSSCRLEHAGESRENDECSGRCQNSPRHGSLPRFVGPG